MPENTVYVGRPTVYGNPYYVGEVGRELALALFRNSANGIWAGPLLPDSLSEQRRRNAYDAHQRFMNRIKGHPLEVIRMGLRGKDLACWCPLGQPCHADILLELANQ